jgi:hypothetical protein
VDLWLKSLWSLTRPANPGQALHIVSKATFDLDRWPAGTTAEEARFLTM